jgi:hypothetical protein
MILDFGHKRPFQIAHSGGAGLFLKRSAKSRRRSSCAGFFLFFLIISGLDPAGLCQWFHLVDDKG